MQPVAELPRLAFESDSVATSRSLSPRTTLPAANELFWLSVDAVNADHVLDPAIVPPAATTSSDSASLCLAARRTSGSRGPQRPRGRSGRGRGSPGAAASAPRGS